MKLCSACLLGINCKYNGKNNSNDKIIELSKKETLIPVCPEQLGGMSTPRIPSEIKGDKVLSWNGLNITDKFEKGGNEVLKLAKLYDIKEFIGKQGSPSCGCGKIHDGTFSNKIMKGDGITISLLKKEGFKITTEENY